MEKEAEGEQSSLNHKLEIMKKRVEEEKSSLNPALKTVLERGF